MAWAPDSKCLASGSQKSPIRLWDTTSGTCVAALGERKSEAFQIAFSRNGKRLVAVHRDACEGSQYQSSWISAWNVPIMAVDWAPKAPADITFSGETLATSDLGTVAVSAGSEDGNRQLCVLHRSTAAWHWLVKSAHLIYTEFAPNGKTLLVITRPFRSGGESVDELVKNQKVHILNPDRETYHVQEIPGVRAATFISEKQLATVMGSEDSICIYDLQGVSIRTIPLVGDILPRTIFDFSSTGDVAAGTNIGTHMYYAHKQPI
jgi:WD40 repeat protein